MADPKTLTGGTGSQIEPASYFEVRLRPRPEREYVWRAITAYVDTWLDCSGPVVELGAGYCDFVNSVRAQERHAVDVSDQVTLHAAAGVTAHVGTCERLAMFEDASCTTVLASNLLEHLSIEGIAATILEIQRVLRPGGRLVAIHPNFRLAPRRYFDDYTHRTVLTDRSLSDRISASGMDIVRVEPRFLPLTMNSRLSFGYKLIRPYLRLPLRPMAGQMLHIAEKRG